MTATCQASCTSPASPASPVITSGTVKSFIAGAVYNYSSTRRIGIIVDSSLGQLPAINDRSAPLLRDRYLPPGFTLIFASDVSVDSIPNALIRQCHSQADRILGSIMDGKTTMAPIEAPQGEPYSHFRMWQWNPTGA